MRALGLQAGWVLVYTSAIVFVIRLFAGSIIARLTPLGTLALASAAAAVGLSLLAGSTGLMLLGAATLYGIGKSFFWGTSLAVASEQFPRGGAVTLNVMAGAGMLAAGIVGSVLLGRLQDDATARGLAVHDQTQGTQLVGTYLTNRKVSILGDYAALDPSALANAPTQDRALISGIEAAGKKQALRLVAFLPVLMLLVYGALILFFRTRGGYRPVVLEGIQREASH